MPHDVPHDLRSPVMGGRSALLTTTVLLVAGCSSSKPAGIGYNTDAVGTARQLGVCAAPVATGNIAECTYPGGDVIGVAAIGSAAQQSYAAPQADTSAVGCVVIGKGFEIKAARTVLEAHLDLARLESKYHASLHGKC